MEDSTKSSSRTVYNKRNSRHPAKNALKEEEKKKVVHPEELSERLIEEVASRIGRARVHSLINRAIEA